jgi:hypothetical protein
VLGYSVALCGAFYYNYKRMAASAVKLTKPTAEPASGGMKKASTEDV